MTSINEIEVCKGLNNNNNEYMLVNVILRCKLVCRGRRREECEGLNIIISIYMLGNVILRCMVYVISSTYDFLFGCVTYL